MVAARGPSSKRLHAWGVGSLAARNRAGMRGMIWLKAVLTALRTKPLCADMSQAWQGWGALRAGVWRVQD